MARKAWADGKRGVSVGRRKKIRRNKEKRYHGHFIFLCIFLNRGHSIFIARTEIKCQIRENKRRNRGRVITEGGKGEATGPEIQSLYPPRIIPHSFWDSQSEPHRTTIIFITTRGDF